MLYIGIDPGMDGGIAALGDARNVVIPMPTIEGSDKGTKRMLDVDTIVRWIKVIASDEGGFDQIKVVGIEKCSAMPGQGVTSMFSFGTTYGMLQGIVRTLALPMILTRPQQWKKLILEGTAKDKGAAIQYVHMRYPNISLRATPRCTTDHDGMADAICIADFMRRTLK